ncbi:MAG TPA: amino acid transporter [Actinomycetota bacterium]|nr:amino acid transporter [Actinomycetota bacterium]
MEPGRVQGPHRKPSAHHQQSWWKVMCLTGVDYFSTLGYQPGIAALAAGALSPIATLVLVGLTLFGALPIYRRVAAESPNGEGSIAMLERLLSWWTGKLFVLALLGFVATDFIITITLSAADATAHVLENPYAPGFVEGQAVLITLVLVALLGAVFLKGFTEAVGIAVALVAAYLALNLVVIVVALEHVVANPEVVTDWRNLLTTEHSSPLAMVAVAVVVFPKLALGLSGFETGVAVMPLVRGDPGDPPERPRGRIRDTRKLLTTAALIMSVFLLTSSFTTTLLIPPDAVEEGGEASGRALAYLAHEYLGDVFGTVYDLSTIAILWFAGASAMAGLLNIVPRYLPRYGMAPEWTRAVRPLVLVFVSIAFAVTIIFRADVEAQGGAYATGVLVLMSSAAVAVTLSARRRGRRWPARLFALITLVFIYTTVVNVMERPDGIRIASFFIAAIVVTSLVSRASRATELRAGGVQLDRTARRLVDEAANGDIRIIANEPNERDELEYREKELEVRRANHIPDTDPVLFLEVTVVDPSEFESLLQVRGEERFGYKVLRVESATVGNTIAAVLLDLRDRTGQLPHVYFGWTEGNPLVHLVRYLIFGDGDVPPITREVLRKAERDRERRPLVHVG